ncbi:hypothetical protein GCM10009001_26190 [Virgibacillus siamensis]|uniref:Uncharacterized protein n=2 Tax=Virgibacillus siamensis TaxID=480071 RepID=A0ABN1GAT5_9BACI
MLNHYWSNLFAYFKGCSSKKAIWEQLNALGLGVYSLANFYHFSKGKSKEEYLRFVLDCKLGDLDSKHKWLHNLSDFLFNTLGINDPHIAKQFEVVRE